MNRLHNATSRIFVALMVGIIAVPVTSTALFLRNEQISEDGDTILEINKRAYEDQTKLRRQRRAYWRAIEHFSDQKRHGNDIEKPDINDLDSVDKTLGTNLEEVEEVHTSADEITSLTTNDLSSQDRRMLRRYTRANMCPTTLKNFPIEGFYELCISIVGEEKVYDKPRTGLLNHSAYIYRKLRRQQPNMPSFKLRMQMMEEALDKSNRREDGVGPGRPTPYTQEPVQGW